MNTNEPVTPVTPPEITPVAEPAPAITPVTEPTPIAAVETAAVELAQMQTQPEPAVPVEAAVVAEAPVEPAAPTERPLSLRERIAAAATEVELDELVALSASDKYKLASNKTRNRWRAVAKARRADLKGTN